MNLHNVTPKKFRCEWGGCPAVFKRANSENLVIIGKRIDNATQSELSSRISSDEFAVEISPEFFEELFDRRRQPSSQS